MCTLNVFVTHLFYAPCPRLLHQKMIILGLLVVGSVQTYDRSHSAFFNV